MIRLLLSLLALLSWNGAQALAADFPELYNTEKEDSRPMSPEETVKTAVLPAGFHLEVFASEPEVQQPIGITFDKKGRLWVAECYTFAETPLRWDMNLQDRVIVLEDTDGDGKSDKRTVFWDQGKRLTSIAVGNGGIWVTCAPQLLFIPDANGDLVPDGDPIVMLDGFDAETIGHNIVNGLKFGPDGWLYGRHGITSTSLVGVPGSPIEERVPLNCGIWRFHPVTHTFEVVCHGGTNPWGLDWNEDGQLFYTNTVIGHLWHAIPGAYYERMFGAHLNPLAYESIGHTADHYHWDRGSEKWSDIRKGISDKTSDLGGGHAHMGCLIYQGGVWPKEYQGKLFTNNLHGRRINMDILEREGNGYVGKHGKDFLQIQDPWFRGLDLITGPDGQVWINDWSDTGECHDNDGIHRTSGRIYRIVYDGPEKGMPTPERPEWLTQRGRAPVIPIRYDALAAVVDYNALLASKSEGHRAMGVRWLVEDSAEDNSVVPQLVNLAKTDPSALVRLELASALQRLVNEDGRFELATALSAHAEDADDRQQPLMIWYGIAPAVAADPDRAIALALSSKLPTVTRLIARRLAENLEKTPEPVNELLSRATPENRLPILRGLNEGLKGWSKAPKPAAWDMIVKAGGNEEVETLLRELSLVFGDGRAREELLKIAGDAEGDAGARRAALKNLLRQPDDALLPLLKEWANDRIISREAILGLASYEEKGVPQVVLNHWQRNPLNRTAAIDTLVSRPSYAAALLKSLETGTLPRNAISPFQARQIQSFGDATLNEQLRALWGDLQETPEATKAEIAQWKKSLTPEVIAQSDSARGKVVFTQTCSACHKLYGEGGAIGPDLTGSDRHNLDYLLGNIVNPNEIVPADYRLTLFTLKDGRILSGVIPEQNERSVTIQSPAERIVIETKDIAKRETLPVSLMPEGLLKSLSETDAHALISYLMSKGPLSDK